MRLLEAIEAALSPSSSTPDPAAADTGSGGKWFHGWLMDCHGLWHNLLLILPSALFLIYLASQAKKNYPKILNGRLHIITALYGFLWLVSILNLAWYIFGFGIQLFVLENNGSQWGLWCLPSIKQLHQSQRR
nr:transmembrane protein adipocyte-associated 1 homolog [Ipomoea batatas]